MNRFSLFTQIGMIIVAVVITIMYIKPTYSNIKTTQDTTTLYDDEAAKVKEVDLMLEQKIAAIDGVSVNDVDALKRYMPDSVDDVSVLKDIQAIFTALQLPISTLTAGGMSPVTEDPRFVAHTFAVTSKMTYEEVKVLLHAIEVNDYLLQINTLKMIPGEEDLVSVDIGMTAFSRASTLPAPVTESDSEAANDFAE